MRLNCKLVALPLHGGGERTTVDSKPCHPRPIPPSRTNARAMQPPKHASSEPLRHRRVGRSKSGLEVAESCGSGRESRSGRLGQQAGPCPTRVRHGPAPSNRTTEGHDGGHRTQQANGDLPLWKLELAVKALGLWGRFDWAPGRCEAQATHVAIIGEIGARGVDVVIAACRPYVLRLEQSHWALTRHRLPTSSPGAAAPAASTPARLRSDGARARPSPRHRPPSVRWGITFRRSNACIRRVSQHRQL